MKREDVELVIYMQDGACARDMYKDIDNDLDLVTDRTFAYIEEYKRSPYFSDGSISLWESIDKFLQEKWLTEQFVRQYRKKEGYYK